MKIACDPKTPERMPLWGVYTPKSVLFLAPGGPSVEVFLKGGFFASLFPGFALKISLVLA